PPPATSIAACPAPASPRTSSHSASSTYCCHPTPPRRSCEHNETDSSETPHKPPPSAPAPASESPPARATPRPSRQRWRTLKRGLESTGGSRRLLYARSIRFHT